LIIVLLEGAHDIFASYYNIHHASDQETRTDFLGFVAHREDVDETHERHELDLTVLPVLVKLERELVLQVAEGVVDVGVPPLHEPSCPFNMSLKLKVPT